MVMGSRMQWLLLLMVSWTPNPLVLAQQPEGVFGYRWGLPLSDVERSEQMERMRSEDRWAVYDVSVGEVEGIGVRSCGMEFVADRLAGIFCITDGKENSQRMVEYLESRFGPPSREGPRALHWFSRGTHISFDGDEQGNGYVYCYSRRMFSTPPRDR